MKSSEKGQFLYSFLILLTHCHETPAPKLTNFPIFITTLSLNVILFPKNPCLTSHLKIMKQPALYGFLKKKKKTTTEVSRTITTSKVEVFLALISNIQPLTNFTKNSILQLIKLSNVFHGFSFVATQHSTFVSITLHL